MNPSIGTTKRKPRAPRVDLDITPDLIRESTQKDSSHCMIAEAVKAAFPGAKSVAVDLQTVRFTDSTKGFRYTYLTPRRGQVALVNFDQGRMPEPFHLRLRSGSVTRSGRKPRGRKTLAVRDQEDAVQVVGGKVPPRSALSSDLVRGKRREFGLRGLER